MRLARLALVAAAVTACVPFATASQARCAQPYATVCSVLAAACGALEDNGVVKQGTCPQY